MNRLRIFVDFWWGVFQTSLKKSFNILLAIATLVGFILFIVGSFLSETLLSKLGWQIPLGVFIVAFIVNMLREPAYLYKEKSDKVQEYEMQAIELEGNTIYESRRGIWVARVGVKAIGQRAIRGIFVYLKYIDGNQNSLFDAPLHPAGRLRNTTGAITVNPGDTQMFVEVLHWNPAVPETGIPYNLNYQLRELGVDIRKSPESLPDQVDVGSHDLILYATGEDIKPIERTFRVEIRDDKLVMSREGTLPESNP